MNAPLRDNRNLFVGLAMVVCITAAILGSRMVAHQRRVAELSGQLAPIVSSNRRYSVMSRRLEKTDVDFKAQLFSLDDMGPVPGGSAAASIFSNRLARFAGHVHDIDSVVLAARRIPDPEDEARIRRDTTIALYRRVGVSDLIAAMKATADDYRLNPFVPLGSGRELGERLGHASYALHKSLRNVREDLHRGAMRQAKSMTAIRKEAARLEHSGPLSL